MAPESGARAARWRRGQRDIDWAEDERAYAALLDALTRDLIETETTKLEMDARSRRSMADVLREEQQVRRDHLAEARSELRQFRAALRDAWERGGEGGEVAYDAGVPEQDEQADLLIQYLVRSGYAEVRTEEPQPGHHVYFIRVDWERLLPLAREQGHPFELSARGGQSPPRVRAGSPSP
jgi:hypothetical protein